MLDPADARTNPRVGDVWRHGPWRFRVLCVTPSRILLKRKLDRRSKGDVVSLIDDFRVMTQTAELIERGE